MRLSPEFALAGMLCGSALMLDGCGSTSASSVAPSASPDYSPSPTPTVSVSLRDTRITRLGQKAFVVGMTSSARYSGSLDYLREGIDFLESKGCELIPPYTPVYFVSVSNTIPPSDALAAAFVVPVKDSSCYNP